MNKARRTKLIVLISMIAGIVLAFNSKDSFGNPSKINAFKESFDIARLIDPLLRGAEIEDYKTVTASLGFTKVINPNNNPEISKEAMERMKLITLRVVDVAKKISRDLEAFDMQVVDTVTPTNAIVEYIPQGACKAESLQWLREQGHVRRARINVFGGDSSGDRTVMEKIFNEVGGIALGVGPKAPDASHMVFKTPEDHVRFLERIEARVAETKKNLVLV